MKAVIVSCLVLCLGLVSANSQIFPERHRHGRVYKEAVKAERQFDAFLGHVPNTTANWFPQLIDHSNPALGTFQDRFFYDLSYYNPTNPVCMMYLAGEGPLTRSVGGYMVELAKNLSACTLAIEHRWYGESLPAPLTDKALLTKTLTIAQAMEDIVALMEYFETTVMNTTITWFLVGGSYSGGMTVWMNERYPGRFKASWAASGVVYATFAYTEYDGHVDAVTSKDCSTALRNIMATASGLYDESEASRERLFGLFNIPSYNTKTDFMWAMADVSASSVQYSMKTDMCNAILPQVMEPWGMMRQYAAFVADQWGTNFMNSCYYSTACLVNSTYEAQWGPGGYSWIWECCNEVAWWQISYPGSIRDAGITTSYFMNQCRQAFYPNASADSWAFNERHHGLHPVVPFGKIIATQGSDDPWSTTGLRVDQGPTFPVNIAQCTNCGHCGSMMTPQPTDPLPLQHQRDMVLNHLREWLNQ